MSTYFRVTPRRTPARLLEEILFALFRVLGRYVAVKSGVPAAVVGFDQVVPRRTALRAIPAEQIVTPDAPPELGGPIDYAQVFSRLPYRPAPRTLPTVGEVMLHEPADEDDIE